MTHDDVLFGYRLQLFALVAERGVSEACRLTGCTCPRIGRRPWSFVKPHLKDAGRLMVADFADKVAQSARGGAAR